MRFGPFPLPLALVFDHELEELRWVEYDLIEEGYVHFVESTGIDPGQDYLGIFPGPFE
jgi:hypothetical protein